MDLKTIFNKLGQTQEEIKHFLAIEIGSEAVKTAVWQVKDKTTEIVKVGSVEEWKSDSVDDLITATDTSLTKALEGIDPEPNETIFGLPESWASEEGIAEVKKTYLKTLSEKLALKPVGFVVTAEALVHFLRKQEGGPPTTILINLSETEAVITLVQQGAILGSQIVGRSEDICKDVEEGLARFEKIDTLPSRMLLYNGHLDLEVIKQNLISYDWQQNPQFLHFPKIESLTTDTTIKAVAIAGGAEVAKSLGLEIVPPPPSEVPPPTPDSQAKVALETTPADSTRKSDSKPLPDKAAEFGFSTTPIEPKEEESPPSPTLLTVGDHQVRINASPEPNISEPPPGKVPTPKVSFLESSKKWFEQLSPARLLEGFALPQLKPLPGKLSQISPLVVFGISALVLLFIGGFLAYWYLPQATVTIYVKPKEIEKEIAFTLAPSQEILDADAKLVPAQISAAEVEGTKEKAATGEKVVGETAKGKVTIYNRTQSAKTFAQGTILSTGSLEFTLDEEVTVASASTEENEDFSTTTVPSTAEANITASEIGDDYNLAKDTQLTVADFATSSFVATTNDLSGGFSRTVQVVADKDQEELREALIEELKQQAIGQRQADPGINEGIVEVATEEIVKEEYSAEVGAEVDSVSLTLTIKLPLYIYNKGDMSLLLQKQFATDIPESFELNPENISLEVVNASLENEKANVTAKAKLKLLPKLNAEEIIQNIKGRYPPVTEDYFASLPNFSQVETEFSLPLPERLHTFPRKAENISVEIKTEE